MLSSVLRGKRAVDINLAIVRTFIRLRHILVTNEDLARSVAQHDRQIAVLFEHVQKMLAPAPVKKHPLGFVPPKDESGAGWPPTVRTGWNDSCDCI